MWSSIMLIPKQTLDQILAILFTLARKTRVLFTIWLCTLRARGYARGDCRLVRRYVCIIGRLIRWENFTPISDSKRGFYLSCCYLYCNSTQWMAETMKKRKCTSIIYIFEHRYHDIYSVILSDLRTNPNTLKRSNSTSTGHCCLWNLVDINVWGPWITNQTRALLGAPEKTD